MTGVTITIRHDEHLGPIVELNGVPVPGLLGFEVTGQGVGRRCRVTLTLSARVEAEIPADLVPIFTAASEVARAADRTEHPPGA